MSKRNRQQKRNISDEESDEDYSPQESSEGEDNNNKKQKSSTHAIDPSSYYVREEDLDDEYDSDYYKDEEDRAYLDSLSELQREKILSERYEERNEKRKRKEILRKQGRLIERGKKMPTTVPTSASGSVTSSTTTTTTTNKSSSVSNSSNSSSRKKSYHDPELDLELDEEEDEPNKSTKSKRSTSTAKRVRKRSSKQASTSDDDNYSDNEMSRQSSRKQRDEADRSDDDEGDTRMRESYDEEENEEEEEEDIYESTLCKITKEDLEKILIRRSALEKEFKEPYFAESVEKAFVRVLVGFNERAKKKTYRLCQIVQVQDMSKDYPFGVNNADKTKKGLLLQFGVQKRTWQMSAISDSKEIEENEYRAWKSEMEKVGEKFPTLKFIEHKIQQWKNLKEYKYTDKEIETMLKEKKILKGGLIVKNKQSITREISHVKTKIKEIMDELYLRSLGKSKQHSSMTSDEENEENEEDGRSERQSDESLINEKAKYEEELKKLEAEYSKIDFLSPTAQKLGKINVKNRAMDQAAHEHRKKNQTLGSNAASSNQGAGQLDPFSRRKTNSSFFVLASESPKEEQQKKEHKQQRKKMNPQRARM
ncbi:hypothetical protein C9374_004568 [Naegleria lovaniensis]|uniref:Plus3 domain-containing protein n=1 Tax=Naegleria lovaniensis TaxID=51637 RepID=A0AA88GQ48_NAELO|nr:uncharacterized protein C9374_004568 [Naegleria lovaniensis]KAG2383231.1 hypothetical protein C9374_004568 [Naegleria lovaniensis]